MTDKEDKKSTANEWLAPVSADEIVADGWYARMMADGHCVDDPTGRLWRAEQRRQEMIAMERRIKGWIGEEIRQMGDPNIGKCSVCGHEQEALDD